MTKLPHSIKEKAISLRKKGYSLQEIAANLKIAKSTSSLWLRFIKLDQKAQNRLAGRAKIGQMKTNEIKLKKREQLLNQFRKDARNDIRYLRNNKSIMKLICAILFWCEGSKTTSQVKFTNSDPEMIKYFLELLRSGFAVDESKLRALVHLHEYHDEDMQIDFWSNLTKIPKNQFHRTYRKPHTQKRMRKNYPGCICIAYYDALLSKKLWAYYKEAPQLLLGA